MLSDSTILKHIARQPKRAAGFKQLVRELGLHGEARGELDGHLRRLVAAGELVQLNSDRSPCPNPRPTRIWLSDASACIATALASSSPMRVR